MVFAYLCFLGSRMIFLPRQGCKFVIQYIQDCGTAAVIQTAELQNKFFFFGTQV